MNKNKFDYTLEKGKCSKCNANKTLDMMIKEREGLYHCKDCETIQEHIRIESEYKETETAFLSNDGKSETKKTSVRKVVDYLLGCFLILSLVSVPVLSQPFYSEILDLRMNDSYGTYDNSFAEDLTGNFNATVTNALFDSDKDLYTFDGSGDYMRITTNIIEDNANFSIMVWVNITDVSGDKWLFDDYNFASGDQQGISFGITNDDILLQFGDGGSGVYGHYAYNYLTANDTYFIIASRNTTGTKIYVNGEDTTPSITGTNVFSLPSLITNIGAYSANSGDTINGGYFNGQMFKYKIINSSTKTDEAMFYYLYDEPYNTTWVYCDDCIDTIDTFTGSVVSGNISSTYIRGDGDYYEVDEAVGTPALDIRFNWTGVNSVDLNFSGSSFYDGDPSSDVWIELYNYTAGDWDSIFEIPEGVTDYTEVSFTDAYDYVGNDIIQGRVYDDSTGNPTHVFYWDYVSLTQGEATTTSTTTTTTTTSSTSSTSTSSTSSTSSTTTTTLTPTEGDVYDKYNEFDSTQQAIFYIFLFGFWLVIVWMCYSFTGQTGNRIQLLNWVQIIVGFLIGLKFIDEVSVLVGSGIILISLTLFLSFSKW